MQAKYVVFLSFSHKQPPPNLMRRYSHHSAVSCPFLSSHLASMWCRLCAMEQRVGGAASTVAQALGTRSTSHDRRLLQVRRPHQNIAVFERLGYRVETRMGVVWQVVWLTWQREARRGHDARRALRRCTGRTRRHSQAGLLICSSEVKGRVQAGGPCLSRVWCLCTSRSDGPGSPAAGVAGLAGIMRLYHKPRAHPLIHVAQPGLQFQPWEASGSWGSARARRSPLRDRARGPIPCTPRRRRRTYHLPVPSISMLTVS